MATQASNFEEAAAIAQEFIYSLDNLPNEVSHLLQEIKYRETRAYDLQQEIDKDTAKYIRYSKKSIPSTSTPPSLAGSRDSSPKSTILPNKINASYAEIQELTAEKCALAQRLIEALARTRARLDDDLIKVRTLQGENIDTPALVPRALMSTTVGTNNIAVASGDPAQALSDSLRNALGSTQSLDSRGLSGTSTPIPTATSSNGTTTKKRRVTTTNSSIKISPASPVTKRSASPSTTAAQTHTSHQKSRLSRQVHPASEDGDMDAEGEEDMDGDDDNEDETLYCFCQRTSYGDMIACDNEGGCPYEWFHLPCVGLKLPTPEKWYCDHCEKTVASTPTTVTSTAPAPRKGRKK